MKSQLNFELAFQLYLMIRDYLNAYFRTLSIIFSILIVVYGLINIGSEEYLESLIISFSYTILPVITGNLLIALFYYYIQKKTIK